MEKIYSMDEGRDSISQSTNATSSAAGTSTLLSAVTCAEDKILIIDVLNAIRMCRHPHGQLCTSWSVHPSSGGNGYILTAYLPMPSSPATKSSNAAGSTNIGGNNVVEVTHDDLGMIESVNLLRVRAGVAHLNADTWALRIHITSHKAPVSFTVHDTLRFTQRRSLLWNATPVSAAANAVVDQGKNLLKNMFGGNDKNRFSMSLDNTNAQHHPSGSDAGNESGRRKREREDSL